MEDPQAEPRTGGALAPAQHKTVMTGLLDAAEIKPIALLRGQAQPDHLFGELPARREITDGQDDMAGPRDTKPGIVVRPGTLKSLPNSLPRFMPTHCAEPAARAAQRWAAFAGP